jgi:hypothetical protein
MDGFLVNQSMLERANQVELVELDEHCFEKSPV